MVSAESFIKKNSARIHIRRELFVKAWILAGIESDGIAGGVFEQRKPACPGNFSLFSNDRAAERLDLLQVSFNVIAVHIDQHVAWLDQTR